MLIQKLIEKRRGYIASGLTDPEDWLISALRGDADASYITPSQAVKNSNVYSCVSILADDVAKLPIHTFKRGGDKGEGMKHPVAALLYGRANPIMTAFIFKQTMQYHVGLYGNAYALIEWGMNGQPVALWPLDPALTTVELKKDTHTLIYKTSDTNGNGIELAPHDVLHFKTLSRDGLVGTPPWQTLIEELEGQNATKAFISKFYRNGTLSSGILKTDSKINREAKNALRKEWERLNAGLGNAGRTAILDNGLNYQSIGMQLDQAQFIETQKFGINEVAKVYRLPPHKLAQLDRATYANAEAMGLEYIKTTLLPIFAQWEQEINYKLFTEKERAIFYVKFNAAAELRGDSQARAEYYLKMIQNGVYTINEVREMEELVGVGAFGDKHYMSLNFTTLDALENLQLAKAGSLKGGEGDGTGEGTADIDDQA